MRNTGRSQSAAATQLTGILEWRDLDGDASITATLDSRTIPYYAVPSLSSVGTTLRVDQLSQENLAGLTQRWRQNVETGIQTLLTRLTSSVFSFTIPLQ